MDKNRERRNLSWKRFGVANCRFFFLPGALACCRRQWKSSSSSCAYLHNLINQFFSFFLPRLLLLPRYTLLHFMYRMLRWKMLKSLKQQQMYRNLISNSLRRSMKTVQLVAVTIPINKQLTVIFRSSMHHPFRWVPAFCSHCGIIYGSKWAGVGVGGGGNDWTAQSVNKTIHTNFSHLLLHLMFALFYVRNKLMGFSVLSIPMRCEREWKSEPYQ